MIWFFAAAVLILLCAVPGFRAAITLGLVILGLVVGCQLIKNTWGPDAARYQSPPGLSAPMPR